MKTFRINAFNFKLFFPTLFISVTALSADSFQGLDQGKLTEYFRKNIGAKCSLANDQILKAFQHSSVDKPQAACFDDQGGKYTMRPSGNGSSCNPAVLHQQVKLAAELSCPATAAGNTGSNGGSSTSIAEKVALGGTVLIAGAQLASVIQKSRRADAAAQAKAGGSAGTANAGSGASGQAGTASAGGGSVASGAITNGAAHGAVAVSQTSPLYKTTVTPVDNGQIIENRSQGGWTSEYTVNKDGEITTAFKNPQGKTVTQKDYEVGIETEMNSNAPQIVNDLPKVIRPEAAKVADSSSTPVPDATALADLAKAKASDTTFSANMTTLIANGILDASTLLESVGMSCGTSGKRCEQVVPIKLAIAELNKLKAQVVAYDPAKTSCSDSAVRADNFCSMIRSPTAQAVGMLMTVGAAAISKMSSASETCGTTSNLSQLAQQGMTIANVACTGMKFMCDSSCGTSEKILIKMNSSLPTIIAGAHAAGNLIGKAIQAEQAGGVAPKIVQCQKHAADIVQFTTQILGLATAAAQAKDCKNKLTAGGGTGPEGGGGAVTMDQMCQDPAQASTLNCKCYANPSAEGCPGAVVKATATNKDNGPLVIKGGGKGSQLAGIDAFRQGSGLSPAARTALGLDTDSAATTAAADLNKSSDAFGAAATAANGTSGAGGLGSGSSGSKDDTAKAEAKDKKFNFGSFGSIGNAIGGFFGDSGSKKSTTGSKFGTEKQIAAAKRQIASDQLRAEISTASGRSNWDKIRTRYVESNSTFIGN